MRLCCVCVCLATLIWPVASLNATAHQEMLELMKYPGYDSGIRPYTEGKAVEVEVDIVLNSVGPVNEMDMTWTVSFYLRQEWTDPRLVLGGVTSVVKLDGDSVYKLWLPDLFFSNNKEGRKHHLTVENHLIYINASTGRILYSQRLTMVLNCEMNLIKFPHDNQMCGMKMESYSFTTDDLVLTWSSSRAATSLLPTAYIPDFKIEKTTTEDCTATYALGTYPCLLAEVRMKREIGFYIFQTYLPSILIVILSWASFWIDHEAVPARISVGLLTVLTITTQLSGSRSQLPRVPYIKAIDVWMSTNLVFVFAAYMEYAVVTVLSRRFKKNKIKKAQRLAAEETREMSMIQIGVEDKGTTPKPKMSSTANSTLRNGPAPSSSPPLTLDSGDTGRKVDKASRCLFPLVYVIFNIVYWVYYLVI